VTVVHDEDAMGTDNQAHAATGALFGIELKRDHILEIDHLKHDGPPISRWKIDINCQQAALVIGFQGSRVPGFRDSSAERFYHQVFAAVLLTRPLESLTPNLHAELYCNRQHREPNKGNKPNKRQRSQTLRRDTTQRHIPTKAPPISIGTAHFISFLTPDREV